MRPTLTPLRSVRALMTTVVPWARKSMAAGSIPALSITSITPCSKFGGVVSDFAVRMVVVPSAAISKATRSVKVPPTSVATRRVEVMGASPMP